MHNIALARRYAYQVIVIEELNKCGCEVNFLQRPISDDPEEKLLLQMQGVIAEYERAKIIERTRRGRLYNARKGHFLMWSILTNETYIGKAYYNREFCVKPKKPRNSMAYRKYENTTKKNMWWYSRNNTQHKYLLRRLVRCGECGYKMFGAYKGKYAYYNMHAGEKTHTNAS